MCVSSLIYILYPSLQRQLYLHGAWSSHNRKGRVIMPHRSTRKRRIRAQTRESKAASAFVNNDTDPTVVLDLEVTSHEDLELSDDSAASTSSSSVATNYLHPHHPLIASCESARDLSTLRGQLGYFPTNFLSVAARCATDHRPLVALLYPLNRNDNASVRYVTEELPFPTYLWMTCPLLKAQVIIFFKLQLLYYIDSRIIWCIRQISKLEKDGMINVLQARLDLDPVSQEQMVLAHTEYSKERFELLRPEDIDRIRDRRGWIDSLKNTGTYFNAYIYIHYAFLMYYTHSRCGWHTEFQACEVLARSLRALARPGCEAWKCCG